MSCFGKYKLKGFIKLNVKNNAHINLVWEYDSDVENFLFIQNTLKLSEKLKMNRLAGQFGFISWIQNICEQLWFLPSFH